MLQKVVQLAVGTVPQEAHLNDYDLWMAAKEGRLEDVRKAADGCDVAWEMMDTDEHSLVYKGRPVRCQAIHVAAYAAHPQRAKDFEAIVEELLSRRANVNAKAYITVDKHTRELEAIHVAAGAGNTEIVRILLKNKASPDAEAKYDGKLHYTPIHDAAWFNRVDTIMVLLEKRAKIDAKNKDGDTALHLAAGQGHVAVVEGLLYGLDSGGAGGPVVRRGGQKEAQHLLKVTNSAGQVPLDLAVAKCRFPLKALHYFTDALEKADRVQAFLKVAPECPSAAPALLRMGRPRHAGKGQSSSQEEEKVHQPLNSLGIWSEPICEEWRQSLRFGAQEGSITVAVLAMLVENAPKAALDLIDCITAEPEVENREHHPLPVRARIPGSQIDVKLSSTYVQDLRWEWNVKKGSGKPWHDSLAPHDARHGSEVLIRVVHLRGLMNRRLVHALACTKTHHLFTNVTIHALIQLMWSQFFSTFVIDILAEALVTMVISYWVWISQAPPSAGGSCTLWCLIAAVGILECACWVCSCTSCLSSLGYLQLYYWLCRSWHKLLIGLVTLLLAISTTDSLQPTSSGNTLLAWASLLHWLLLLYDLRAFEWTGRRLLPIMHSVIPITGMLVIMFFVGVGFLHAFWSLDPSTVSLVSVFNVDIILFTGNTWFTSNDLDRMPNEQRVWTVLFSMMAIFVFLTVTINVFIAVLSDVYAREEGMMTITFLMERCRICSSYFLRPKLRIDCVLRTWKRLDALWKGRLQIPCALLVLAGVFGITALLIVLSTNGRLSPWCPAAFISGAVLFLQSLQADVRSRQWDTHHLWFCHETSLDEDDFLPVKERREVEQHSYLAELEGCIEREARQVTFECKKLLRKQVSEQASSLEELAQALYVLLHEGAEGHKPLGVGEVGRRSPAPAASGLEEPGRGRLDQVSELRQGIQKVSSEVKELRSLMEKQGQANLRVESACATIADALNRVVQAAIRRGSVTEAGQWGSALGPQEQS